MKALDASGHPLAGPVPRLDVEADTVGGREPYTRLDDLMTVMEQLCPVWPARDVAIEFRELRL